MLAHDHIRDKEGQKIHIISTFVSGQIKQDREYDIDPSKYCHIVQHVNTYIQQDVVSLTSLSMQNTIIYFVITIFKLI